MAQVTALEQYACVACGARAEWNPAKQALICSFCGTAAPGKLDSDTGKIREIDLARTLREMPEELRGWQTDRRSVQCRSCQAVSVFDPQHVGKNCEFCGSAELVDYDEIKSPLRPQSVSPFKVDDVRVRRLVRRWYAGRWFAPGKFKRNARVDTIRGVYLPYWTFDAQVRCPWTAQSGTYYYTTQTYRDSRGRTRTRQVQRVRWRPASGQIDHFFDDHPIPATRGVDHDLLKKIEPFPMSDLVPYDTAYLSGFVVEHYQIVLFDAAQAARTSMNHELERMCGNDVPGDTYRNLQTYPEFSGETFKHILVPVWLLLYRYRAKPYQLIVNGSTGEIAGRYPRSFWKIFFLALTLTAAAAVIAGMFLLR
jgi:hypothetical protein